MTVAIFTGSRELPIKGEAAYDIWTEIHGLLVPFDGDIDAALVGCCPTGLDYLVREVSGRNGFAAPLIIFKAHWNTEGRSAGPKRNSRMVKAAAALAEALGVELVCHAWPIGESRGTRDCMRKAKAAGARVVVHTEEG